MTATAITPIHPATILPAPEDEVLEAVAPEPVAEPLLLAELPEVEEAVESAVEEESVAEAVDEPVVVLLALVEWVVVDTTAVV